MQCWLNGWLTVQAFRSLTDRVQGPHGRLPPSMANEEDDPVVQEVTAAPALCRAAGSGTGSLPSSGRPGACCCPSPSPGTPPSPGACLAEARSLQVSDPASWSEASLTSRVVTWPPACARPAPPALWPLASAWPRRATDASLPPLRCKLGESSDFVPAALCAKPRPVLGVIIVIR